MTNHITESLETNDIHCVRKKWDQIVFHNIFYNIGGILLKFGTVSWINLL